MDVHEITDAGLWDGFVGSQPESSFLQSWLWGEFQATAGRKLFRLGVFEGTTLVSVAQCILQQHPLGIRSLSVYRGPVVSRTASVAEYTEVVTLLFRHLTDFAKTQGAAYLHVEPLVERHSASALFYSQLPGWKAVASSQPADSLLLDLSLDEATLLTRMHEKTRYNIRLAERKGVQINGSTDDFAVDHFLRLTHVTATRDEIHVHPDAYYRDMVRTLGSKGFLKLFLATYDDKVLAANLVSVFGDTVTYLHGASSNEQRNVMAPYLLQWRQIQWARQQAKRWYDFWGVAPAVIEGVDTKPHPWDGITRFKRGFGGEQREYLGAIEKPVHGAKYSFVALRRKLRR